jgi:hypothetical protein
MHYPPGSNLAFPSTAVQPIRAHAPNQNPAPKAEQQSPATLATVCVPPEPARPQNIPPSTTDSHAAFRAPSPSGLAKGHHPSSVDERSGLLLRMVNLISVHGFRRPRHKPPPRYRRRPIWTGGVYGTKQKRVWIEVAAPSHEVSLIIKSCHQEGEFDGQSWHPHYHRESVFRCSPLMWSCYNPSIRILPCMRPRPHNQDPSPVSDESRYGGPGRSV